MSLETTKNAVDWLSVGAVGGTILGFLPAAASAVSIAWFVYRFWAIHQPRRHCVNAVPGCPSVCPSFCPNYRSRKEAL